MLGVDSDFDREFGYWIDGVARNTAAPPEAEKGYILVPLRHAKTDGAAGWCLELHDIAIVKYLAHREKNGDYVGKCRSPP